MVSDNLKTLKIVDDRGYTYLPTNAQEELGIDSKCEIPYITGANLVVLGRRGFSLTDILEGMELLKKKLILRGVPQ